MYQSNALFHLYLNTEGQSKNFRKTIWTKQINRNAYFAKGLYLLQKKYCLYHFFKKEALLVHFQLLDVFKRNGLCQVDIITLQKRIYSAQFSNFSFIKLRKKETTTKNRMTICVPGVAWGTGLISPFSLSILFGWKALC